MMEGLHQEGQGAPLGFVEQHRLRLPRSDMLYGGALLKWPRTRSRTMPGNWSAPRSRLKTPLSLPFRVVELDHGQC